MLARKIVTVAMIMLVATAGLSIGRMGIGRTLWDWSWTRVLRFVVMSVSTTQLYTFPSTYMKMVSDSSVHLSVCLSVCLICLSMCRSVCLSDCLLICPTVCSSADSSVLCFIQWTDNLTTHFQEQLETIEGKASFQYIGTSTGLLKFYPGTDFSVIVGVVMSTNFRTSISASDWSLLNRCDRCLKTYPPVDTYDVRSRPW